MDLRQLEDEYREEYDKLATHVIQSWEWGEFRKKLGTSVLRYGIFKNGKLSKAFQLTLHKIPYTSLTIGYLPKGPSPDKELAEALQKIGAENKCAFIKVEPDIIETESYQVYPSFLPSPKPYFTEHNFIIDLTQPEEDLLKNMHTKARYNIRLAQKKGVFVEERTDNEAFEMYLKLYFNTTKRQGYYGHNRDYHKTAWETLKKEGLARLLIGFYIPEGKKKPIPLTAWMLLNFKDTLYYPYGGSSDKYREVMSSNLVAWEAIKLGKKMGLKKFDMWGALGPDADPKHPHFGFHQFKLRHGGKLVKYLGTYDLVFQESVYWAVTFIDKFTKLKVMLLKLAGR